MFHDIMRYIRIRRISSGRGHPELVPVGGATSYPRRAGPGAAEGKGCVRFGQTRRSGARTLATAQRQPGARSGVLARPLTRGDIADRKGEWQLG